MRTRSTLVVLGLALAAGATWLALREKPVPWRLAAQDAGEATAQSRPGVVAGAALEADADARVAISARVPAAEGSRHAIEILDSRGVPLAGAAWALFRREEVLASGSTGEDGLAHYEIRREADVELAVAHPLHPVLRHPLEPGAGRWSVRLDEGAAVAGQVLLDGGPSLRSIELTLVPVAFWGAGLPDSVCKAVRDGRPKTRTLSTGEEGAFRFEGLAPGKAVKLTWDVDAFLEPKGERSFGPQSGSRDLQLDAPDANLVLRLVTPSEITGQVLDPTTGHGLPRARARCAWLQPGGSAWVEGYANDAGFFRLSLAGELPERCELRVADMMEGLGARTFEFEIPPGVRSYNAGAHPLAALREVAFIVRGPSGEPIENACLSRSDTPWQARSTGPDGRGMFTAGPGDTAVHVTALGYAQAEVVLASAEQMLEVVLQPDTMLEVRLSPALEGLALELHAPEAPFVGERRRGWSPEPLAWAVRCKVADEEQGPASFENAEDGVYVLSGLRPGIPLELRVVDPYGLSLLQRPLPPLDPGERRIVGLPIEARLGKLAGRVVRSDGAPVRRALVGIVHAGIDPFSACATTGADGRFEMTDVAPGTVRLMVAGKDIAPLLSEEVTLPAESLELVAHAGRSIRVSALGPGGALPPRAWVDLCLPGLPPYGGVALDTGGVAQLEHAPAGECIVGVSIGGRRFEETLGPGEGEAMIELPSWQSCTLVLDQPALRIGELRHLQIRSLDGFNGLGSPQLQGAPDEEVHLEVVFPGRYEAGVRSFDYLRPLRPEGEVIGGPVEFEVTAGAPARVRIEQRE